MSDVLPVQVPIKLYRGDTRIWIDVFTVAGTPMDLTGYTFLAQIRATADAPDAMAVLEVTADDAAAGRIRRVLTSEEARKLVPGKAAWDFQVTSADGYTRTIMAGVVLVVADVSRVIV